MGQLVVRFPGRGSHVCEQTTGWRPFEREGVALEWCSAIAFAQMSVVAVRAVADRRQVIGSTFPGETRMADAHAHAVVDGHGGARRLVDLEVKPATRSERMPLIGIADVVDVGSIRYRVPTIDLAEYEVEPAVLQLVPRELCERHCVMPVSWAGGSLIVAMTDPDDHTAREALAAETRFKIEPVLASAGAIRAAIARYYAV